MTRPRSAARAAPPVLVGAVGLAGTIGTSVLGRLSARDAFELVGFAVGGAVVAGAFIGLLLVVVRRRSVGMQAAVAALAAVGAVGLGVSGASWAMFISPHDLHALLVVLVAASTVGLLAAMLIGSRVAAAGRSLGEMARQIGTSRGPDRTSFVHGSPSELTALADELAATSVQLTEAREQAAALERNRRELIAWVSHDLRTPLAGIRAMVEALEDGVVSDSETVARFHRTMRQEADRLAGLVDDLFELSRIQADALGLDLEAVALDELVSEAIAGVAFAASAKGIDLQGVVPPPSPVVSLSSPEMARVVRNLLDNAIRHTPAGGTVTIEAGLDAAGEAAVVSVLDRCGGIPERDIDHVFEMAYRGDAARTPGGGAGLGLAVARGLVEAHQGEISVQNIDGGCRFTVRLPLAVG